MRVEIYAIFANLASQQIYAIFIYAFLSIKYLVSYAETKIVRYKFMQPDMTSQNSHK